MPLDPMIANPAKLELPNPLADSQMFLQNSLAMRQIDDANRKRRRGQALDNAFASSRGADGTLDPILLDKTLLDAGLGEELAAIQQHRADLAYKNKQGQHIDSQILGEGAKTDETKMKTNHERLKAKGTWLAAIEPMFKSVKTPDEAKSVLEFAADEAVNNGVFTPEGATKWRDSQFNELDNAVKTNSLPDYLARHQMSVKDALQKTYVTLQGAKQNKIYAMPTHGDALAVEKATIDAPERKGVNVNVNTKFPDQPAVDSFGDTFGKNEANDLSAIKEAANTAPNVLRDVNKIRGQLKKAFTGKAAGAITDIVAWGKAAGLNVPNDRLIASQVVRKYLKDNIFSLIAKHKMEGASVTPFSNVDMKITEDSSASQELDVAAINKLMDDLEDAAYESADKYGRTYDTVMSGPRISPTVKALMTQKVTMPPRQYRDDEGDVIGDQYIQRLRANPGAAAAFDKEVGVPGLAAKILKGGTSTQAAPFKR